MCVHIWKFIIILFPLWKWWFQFGWASHPFANCWKFYNIYFLKNNGTMWQTVHLRFTYFTLFDLTILTFIFCPNIILWVDVKITLLSIESSLTLLRLFKAEEKSWLSLLFWEVDISSMWNPGVPWGKNIIPFSCQKWGF